MSRKAVLGVDCDVTLVSTDLGWLEWLRKQAPQTYPLGDYEPYPYNLGKLFPNVEDPYRYWRELDYSSFSPLPGSVESLRELSKWFDIVFISQHKGTHGKSKYYWLEEHFPFLKGVILTKEKWILNDSVVAMIDDRLEHLEGFDQTKRILFETNYTQHVECPVRYGFSKWDSRVVKDIINLLGDVE